MRTLGARFDHVAHAVPSIRDVLPIYCDLLGGRLVVAGMNLRGQHRTLQFEYANGGRIELVEPFPGGSSALDPLLARSPRGALHHVTFKVDDLEDAIAVASRLGYSPFLTNLDYEHWKETFLHPRQTSGVLIQLVQASEGFPPRWERSIEEALALEIPSGARGAPRGS